MLETTARLFQFTISFLTSTLRTRLSIQLEIAALRHQPLSIVNIYARGSVNIVEWRTRPLALERG